MDIAQRNLATSRRWLLEVFNNHDLDAVPEIISPVYVNVGTTNRIGHAAGADVINQADVWSPDRKIEIKYAVAQDDLVMVLFRLFGTHTGPYRELQPSGRPYSVWLSDTFRFDNTGLMTEGWVIGKGDLLDALGREEIR
ncbi:ester cyclase [Nonomuraea aurantiaca]|uniref:ester cyclase n=1 Tax=Nonomuraea aurantiaca TaxID=2878562 RepID=UPI001CD9F45E|nr:ester cyclase [Nonomuraea aurantiaca]MCA2230318.1 ester cyclase [Nonomuraea aurantiaca]